MAIPGAESVTVDTPTYKVGDEWRFTGPGYQSRIHIVEVTEDTVVNEREVPARLATCAGCRVVRDRNLTVLRIIRPDAQARFNLDAGLRDLDFPLRVGKTWDHTLDMASSGGPSSSYFNRFTVEAYEMVKVPAGTFKAFRVRHDQENLTSRRRFTRVSWWSPEVRWFVKGSGWRESGFGYGEASGADLALASYSLK
jgi:hypothetical protein